MVKLFTEFLQVSDIATIGGTPGTPGPSLDQHGMVESLSRIIEKELEPLLLFKGVFKEDRQLMRGGGRERRFPKKKATNAVEYGEGQDVPFNTPGILRSFVQVELTKFGAMEEITAEMIDDGDFPVINDVKESLLDAMARFHDAKALNSIGNAIYLTEADGTEEIVEAVYSDTPGVFTLANDKILTVIALTHTDGAGTPVLTTLVAGTDYVVDYYLGKIETLTSTGLGTGGTNALYIEYGYVDQTSFDYNEASYTKVETAPVDATLPDLGGIGYKDIVLARALVKAKRGMPDSIYMDDTSHPKLVLDDKFLANDGAWADQIGKAAEFTGTVAGLKLHETTVMFEGCAIILKSKDIGWEVMGKPLTTRMEIIPGRVGDQRLMVEQRNAFAIVRPELICFVFNTADHAADL